MKWWIKILLTIIIALIIVYLVGPHPTNPKYDTTLPKVPTNKSTLENYIDNNEGRHILRRDNEARIVWNDSLQQPTDYAIVYLHGFSASQEEGNPAHRRIAKKFGCNLNH